MTVIRHQTSPSSITTVAESVGQPSTSNTNAFTVQGSAAGNPPALFRQNLKSLHCVNCQTSFSVMECVFELKRLLLKGLNGVGIQLSGKMLTIYWLKFGFVN